MSGGTYNYREYTSRQEALADIETLWTTALKSELGIDRKDFQVSWKIAHPPENRSILISLFRTCLLSWFYPTILTKCTCMTLSISSSVILVSDECLFNR